MNRYIDADKLMNDFYDTPEERKTWSEAWWLINHAPTADVVEADKAQKEIDYWHDKAQSYEQTILKLSLNKADVVEVVRCKDCVYREVKGEGMTHWFGCRIMEHNDDDWYCSYGERAK